MAPLHHDDPRILGPLPGPRSAAWLKRDHRVMSPSYTRVYPLVVRRARGAMIEDMDGNRFLDFTAGIAVTNVGHSHPRVVAAIERQSRRLIHMSGTDFYYAPQVRLAEQLARRRPAPTRSGFSSPIAGLKRSRPHSSWPVGTPAETALWPSWALFMGEPTGRCRFQGPSRCSGGALPPWFQKSTTRGMAISRACTHYCGRSARPMSWRRSSSNQFRARAATLFPPTTSCQVYARSAMSTVCC